jgi:photosystem II stability/assembly factor-like uncharacterized protein
MGFGKTAIVALGCFGALVLTGCASSDSAVGAPPSGELRQEAVLEIHERGADKGMFEQLDVAAVGGESLRGLSVPAAGVVWVSGAGGVVARTSDSGSTWIDVGITEAKEDGLDLRCIVAFDQAEAWAASSGPGEASRLFHTTDGGNSWVTVIRNTDPAGFYDGLAFWDRQNGMLLGDPTEGYLTVLVTGDGGESWERVGDAKAFALPAPAPVVVIDGDLSVGLTDEQRAAAAAEAQAFSDQGDDAAAVVAMVAQAAQIEEALNPMGEYCFAASNQSIELMGRSTAWIGTGGKVARVFKTMDRGLNWTVATTPLLQGDEASGVFALAFRDFENGVAVGGKYTDVYGQEGNCAVTSDGGETWRLVDDAPFGYRSSVCDVPGVGDMWMCVGTSGSSIAEDSQAQEWSDYFEGVESVRGGEGVALNSVACDPKGQALWTVGARGYVARMPANVKEVVWD